MNMKVSMLLAVTLLTPNKIVFSSLPCEVLKPCRRTKPTHPLSVAEVVKCLSITLTNKNHFLAALTFKRLKLNLNSRENF